MKLLLAAALALGTVPVIIAESPQDSSGLLATWKDGEVRETFDASARVSQLAVAVMPSGPHGSLTVSVAGRWQGRARIKPLTEFEVRADVGLRVNPNFIRQPTMRFLLDPGAPVAREIELTERLIIPPAGAGSAIDTGTATITLVELVQLLRAEDLRAEIFGLPLTFTPAQQEALRRFGDRALAAPQAVHQ